MVLASSPGPFFILKLQERKIFLHSVTIKLGPGDEANLVPTVQSPEVEVGVV